MTPRLRPHGLLLMLALAVAAAGCDFGSVTTAPTNADQSNVPFSQTDLTVGTGDEATAGKTVAVQYGAWLYSDTAADHKGKQWDQSQISFTIGVSNIIKGFEQGVTGMKAGGTRRVIVPPSLGFGAAGNSNAGVPGNAALVFDIALISVQ